MCLVTYWTGTHQILLSGQFCRTIEDSTYILILLRVAKEIKNKYSARELKMFEKYNQEQIWEKNCKWLAINPGDTAWHELFMLWHIDIIYTANQEGLWPSFGGVLFAQQLGPGLLRASRGLKMSQKGLCSCKVLFAQFFLDARQSYLRERAAREREWEMRKIPFNKMANSSVI